MSAPTLEKILQAVNEKYGTSFEGWSQLPTAYEVGDTVPNWNAYEKIMLPRTLFAYEFELNRFIAGEIKDDWLYIYAAVGTSQWWIMNPDGKVLGHESLQSKLQEILNGINAYFSTSFNQQDDEDKAFTVGQTIPSWAEYEKILIQ